MEKQKLLKSIGRGKLRFAVICMAFVMLCQAVAAQGIVVKGRVVYASDSNPIIAATVMIQGTQVGTVTDSDGNYTLQNVKEGAVIEASYIGFESMAVTVDRTKKTYDFSLKEDSKQIDDVVVVGYGTMRKKEVTGAVSRIESDELTRISTPDVGSALQGQIAGVNVQSSSGQPGSQANIQIRGISSVNGSNNPLYVVDGVPFESDPGLSPQEIESIDVLKDAASAAIYGTRGAGGVVLITTKGGKEGQMKISVDINYGIQQITSGLSLVNASEYIYLQTVANQGTYTAANYMWNALWNNTRQFSNNSNLKDVIEQDNQPVMSASITASGGNKGATYSIVGSYYRQDGVVINSGYERYNLRANTTMKRKKWTLTANLSGIFSEQTTPAWGLYNEVFTNKPTSTQVDPSQSTISSSSDDTNEATSMATMLAKFKQTTTNDGRSFNLNTSVNYDITKELALNTRLGAGYTINKVETVNPLFVLYDSNGDLVDNAYTRSYLKEEYRHSNNLSWETMMNYHKQLGKHDIKATAVFSMEEYGYESFYASAYDLVSNDLVSLGATTGENLVGVGTGQWGQDRTSTLVGMLGRVQYNYDSRYMFSASLRRDGSSRFTEANRWGYFPSASAGWNISEEEFWKPIESTISSAKLRVSYGTTGNQNFIDYAYASSVSTDYDYAFGGTSSDVLAYGSTQTSYSNADVKWETTEQYNIGLDLSFLKSRLSFTADIYQSNKKDMLFPLKIPPVAGTGTSGTVILNVGDMENKGVELALRWRDWKKGFNYWANATFSKNINEITKMAGSNKMIAIGTISTPDNSADDITFLAEGYEAGAFFMMPTAGVINTDEKLQEYQKLRSDAKMGDLIYVDSNDDGVLDDNDRVFCGSGAPEFELGFNYGGSYKGFDFSMNWYASIGNEVVNGSKIVTYQNGTNRDLLYCWSTDNPSSTIPAYRTTKTHYNTRAYADKWVEDGSFLRLKNVTVGYSLPKKLISRLNITKLRVYVAADNLLTFTKYDGYDPEVGSDGLSTRGLDDGNYPISSQVRAGVQLEF